MHWYLIWFFVVTLPNGETRETIEARMQMESKEKCELVMPLKLGELEDMIGTMGRVYGSKTIPSGGQGTITGVTVGCVQR